jgi:hypothetical protein
MPQPLSLAGGGSGTLLVLHHTRTLLHACPGGVVLKVEQVLCVPSQRSHPGVEVRALEVGHGLKTLLPHGVLLIQNWEKRDRQCCCSGKAVSHKEVRVMCTISSTPVLGLLPMMDPNHGYVGSKGIITLTSHWSMPWAWTVGNGRPKHPRHSQDG